MRESERDHYWPTGIEAGVLERMWYLAWSRNSQWFHSDGLSRWCTWKAPEVSTTEAEHWGLCFTYRTWSLSWSSMSNPWRFLREKRKITHLLNRWLMNIYSISSLILETGNITNRNGIRFVLYFCFVFSCSLSFPSFSFLFVWKQHLVVLEDYFCLSVCRLLLPVLICSRRNQIQASCFHSLLTFFLVFFFFLYLLIPFISFTHHPL